MSDRLRDEYVELVQATHEMAKLLGDSVVPVHCATANDKWGATRVDYGRQMHTTTDDDG